MEWPKLDLKRTRLHASPKTLKRLAFAAFYRVSNRRSMVLSEDGFVARERTVGSAKITVSWFFEPTLTNFLPRVSFAASMAQRKESGSNDFQSGIAAVGVGQGCTEVCYDFVDLDLEK